MGGWSWGLGIGSHFQNEPRGFTTVQKPFSRTSTFSFHRASPVSFLHLEILVTVDFLARPSVLLIYVPPLRRQRLHRAREVKGYSMYIHGGMQRRSPPPPTAPTTRLTLFSKKACTIYHPCTTSKSRSIEESLDRGSQKLKWDVSEVAERGMGQWAWPRPSVAIMFLGHSVLEGNKLHSEFVLESFSMSFLCQTLAVCRATWQQKKCNKIQDFCLNSFVFSPGGLEKFPNSKLPHVFGALLFLFTV